MLAGTSYGSSQKSRQLHQTSEASSAKTVEAIKKNFQSCQTQITPGERATLLGVPVLLLRGPFWLFSLNRLNLKAPPDVLNLL